MTSSPPTSTWTGRAPAKTNLFLRILAREASGYHVIETLFQALDLSDSLALTLFDPEEAMPAPAGPPAEFDLQGTLVRLELRDVSADELGDPRRNLVVRAAESLLASLPASWVRPSGLQISLTKTIPHGAGLGGGSSDAATTLRGLNELLGAPLSTDALRALGAGLGSDVPFFLAGASLALGWGRGQRLLTLPPLPSRPAIVAIPPFGISTPEAYADLAAQREAAAEAGAGPLPGAAGPRLLHPGDLGRWDTIEALAENDFHVPTEARHPELATLRGELRDAGAGLALLSGSGSAVVGVFADEGARDRALAGGTTVAGTRLIPTRTLGASDPPSGTVSN